MERRSTEPRSGPRLRRSPRGGYRGSGTLAMCGPGPHPGGDLFRSLCKLADRFQAQGEAPEAAKIGSILSLVAFYATKPNDRDFRYALGSLLMDLAIDDELRSEQAADGAGDAERTSVEPNGVPPVPYSRARTAL
jgi:hypothetical protein